MKCNMAYDTNTGVGITPEQQSQGAWGLGKLASTDHGKDLGFCAVWGRNPPLWNVLVKTQKGSPCSPGRVGCGGAWVARDT